MELVFSYLMILIHFQIVVCPTTVTDYKQNVKLLLMFENVVSVSSTTQWFNNTII